MLLTPLLTIETYRPHIFSATIPGLDITLEPRFYGLFYAIILIVGSKIMYHESKRYKLGWNEDQAMNYLILPFIAGLFGARIYEVIFEWKHHYSHEAWWEVFAVWHGGLAIHGGIIAGLAMVTYLSIKKKIPMMIYWDTAALIVIFGQALGRWGNFTNGEAAGPVTDFWTGVVFPPGSPTYRYAQGQAVHPTMIYESLACLALGLILWKVRLKPIKPGTLAAGYLVGYAVIRSSLTPFRMDNQYFILFGEKVLAAYTTSTVMILLAIALVVKLKLWEPRQAAAKA